MNTHHKISFKDDTKWKEFKFEPKDKLPPVVTDSDTDSDTDDESDSEEDEQQVSSKNEGPKLKGKNQTQKPITKEANSKKGKD